MRPSGILPAATLHSATMKKALIVVAAIVGSLGLIFWIATWFRADEAVATSASRPWPGGMGTLD